MGIRKYKPTTPGRRGCQRRRLRRDHSLRLRRSRCCRPLHKHRWPQRLTAASPPATSVVVTSVPTASSTSGARQGRRSAPRSRTSSTTRTAPPASRCCTTLDGEKRYIIAPRSAQAGRHAWRPVPSADIKPGNNLPLRNIPVGTVIHAVELRPGGGAKIARSAGCEHPAARQGRRRTRMLRMPSGEIRHVDGALPRHRRRGWQRRAVQHQLGQGRPDARGRVFARPFAVSQ
jgi:large subunit ribosomal protein L2